MIVMEPVFLNGEFMPLQQARISPLDRGFLFGDGVYEVIPVYHGNVFRLPEHLQRLQKSCEGIRLNNPYTDAQWSDYIQQFIDQQPSTENCAVYIQLTRGAAPVRDHLFPNTMQPTVFMCNKSLPAVDPQLLEKGVSLITQDDIRWQWCHLKTVSLVSNIVLKKMAYDAGADDVILLRNGYATECASSNFFVVQQGIIRTAPKDKQILPGITRDLVIELLDQHNIPYEEMPIPAESLVDSEEIWVCSSMRELIPACILNNQTIGDGQPGPLWKQVYALFQGYKQSLMEQ